MQFNQRTWLDFSVSLLVKIWGAGASFLLAVVIANRISVEQAGLFFLCMAIVLVASVISRQGFDNLLVKSIAYYSKEGSQKGINLVSGWALRRVLVVSGFISLLVYYFAEAISAHLFGKPELAPVLAVFAWTFITASLIQTFVSMLKGVRSPRWSIFFMTAALPTVMLVLIYGSDLSSAEEAGYLFLWANIMVLIAVVLLWVTRFYNRVKDDLLIAEVVSTYGSSLMPFFYTSVLFVFIQYFTQIYIGAVLSSSDVALLSVSLRVAMLISFVMVAINAVASPRFAIYFKANQLDHLKAFSNKVSLLLLCFGLIAFVTVQVFAEQILLLFGKEYLAAAGLLRILALGQFINVGTGSVGALLQMSGNEKYFLMSVFIACIVSVAGSVVLVPVYVVTAAAWVVAGAVAIQNLLAFFLVKQKLGFYSLGFR